MLTTDRFTNIASLSSVPATFLDTSFDFWTTYLMAAASLVVSVGPLLSFRSRLGMCLAPTARERVRLARDMRSIVQAMVQPSACLGPLMATSLSTVSRNTHLVVVYGAIAGTMGVCSALF